MIDPRFPPQPRHLKVPLYPPLTMAPATDKAQTIAQTLRLVMSGDAVVRCAVFASATDSLLAYLRFRQAQCQVPLAIALPAYICPHLSVQLRAHGLTLIFLDIDQSLFFTCAEVQRAAVLGANVLIWPVFFGLRPIPEGRIRWAQRLGLRNIVDGAQAFPGISFNGPWDTLISFGRSKRLGAIAGGAVVFASADDAQAFRRFQHLDCHHADPLAREVTAHLHQARKATTLPQLLDSLTLEPVACSGRPLNDQGHGSLHQSIAQLRAQDVRMRSLYRQLQRFVAASLGTDALALMKDLTSSTPTVVALRVPASRRFQIAAWLSEKGIQTTWYYYPANRIRVLRDCTSTQTSYCALLASEVLVLPFSSRVSASYYDPYMAILMGPWCGGDGR